MLRLHITGEKSTVIELQHVRAFLAVAEELHFGRAAERLGIAQPPLSRTIRQLENRLGTQLFRRTTRSVTLTPAGSALVQPAHEVLASLEAAERAVQQAEMGHVGTVRVGYTGPASYRHIATLVKAVKEQKPGITLVLQSNTFTLDATSQLMNGEIDLALLRRSVLPSRLAGYPIDAVRPVVVVQSDHRFASMESVPMSELREEQIITLPAESGSSLRESLFHWCHEAGFRPNLVQDVPDSPTMTHCVAVGVGIAVNFDKDAINTAIEGVTCVPLVVDNAELPCVLACREDDAAPALREVLTIAKQVLPRVD